MRLTAFVLASLLVGVLAPGGPASANLIDSFDTAQGPLVRNSALPNIVATVTGPGLIGGERLVQLRYLRVVPAM